MENRTTGGEVASAFFIIRNSRHLIRARRRAAANVIQRLRLFRGAALSMRLYVLEAMTCHYNRQMTEGSGIVRRGDCRASQLVEFRDFLVGQFTMRRSLSTCIEQAVPARPDRRSWHRSDERRCRAGSLERSI